MITDEIANKIVEAGIEKVKVRSVLGMPFKTWCMSKNVMGMGLARRDLVSIGESMVSLQLNLLVSLVHSLQ